MKRVLYAMLLLVCIPVFASHTSATRASSYDITGIYELVELKDGSKSLDSYDNVKDAKAVLVPTSMETGTYEVELTRIDDHFYQIDRSTLYIEAPYCYEYAIQEDAILNITSRYGYKYGEVIFLD